MRFPAVQLDGAPHRIPGGALIKVDGHSGTVSLVEVESKPKRLKLDFDFVADEPLWDVGGHAKDAADIVGAGHIEQQGVVSGTLHYGEEMFTLHPSIATRDHCRGELSTKWAWKRRGEIGYGHSERGIKT